MLAKAFPVSLDLKRSKTQVKSGLRKPFLPSDFPTHVCALYCTTIPLKISHKHNHRKVCWKYISFIIIYIVTAIILTSKNLRV